MIPEHLQRPQHDLITGGQNSGRSPFHCDHVSRCLRAPCWCVLAGYDQQLIDKHIPFIAFAGAVTSPYAINIDSNYYVWGRDMAQGIVRQLGGKGNVVMVKGINRVEAYTSSTNTWRTVAPLPTARGGLAAATARDGRIYAIGGDFRTTVEVYTPSTNAWRTVAPLHTSRSALAAATGRDGRVYAFGGIHIAGREPNPVSWGVVNTVEAYTPAG